MEDQRVTLRRVTPTDVDDVAAIFRTSRRHFLPYLPDLHSFEEDKDYFSNVVFKENEVWVAEENDVLVGFCAFRKEWLDHLYFLPARVSKNLGATLLDRAKQEQPLLQLWVFQQNTRATSFYERHGFRKVRETDGSACEEKLPDALYEWRRQTL
ncbi:GNAT family N-acetyltransferase [Agrobacterium tumefaciens]|jgi:ribosomal protein S18 acetylase RimI-like enzyme|uniref:GNAT family N-acetyltransferase n=1 Tax=Agrobacterium tumefaciens TaxID=358 RepID=UPI000DDAADFE|nr:GNAT family N-acetyltransferase [Agrobacterium tumefaciens]UXS10488.1 GNAT family N-acetyltransferase [Agrobacterium tumefaciens]UXS17847.1 GNAT family N-acetyltransferase [Agrobacterium tumefaciens]UXT66486.1 GNAT family N-acetyltransferase [Agrobacterium tumefaciens]